MNKILILSVLLIAGCASYPLIVPSGAGTVIIATDPTGCTFNDDGYQIWLSEGVPASYFVESSNPPGHHITNALYHVGNQIRLNRANGIYQTNPPGKKGS